VKKNDNNERGVAGAKVRFPYSDDAGRSLQHC
jgi:hypothetical protein